MESHLSGPAGYCGPLSPCLDLPTHSLPRLKIQPRTPEATQRAVDFLPSTPMELAPPESPRTPKGARIPDEAYTVCPGAPGPKHTLLEAGCVPPPPWWGACK